MERLSIQELEKMTHSKYVSSQKIKLIDEIFGDNESHILDFDIFDGFAYCANYKGKEYYMIFPKKEFIRASEEMKKNIRDFLEIDTYQVITEKEILASYNTLFINK